jgi:hypothetical protein
VAERRPRRRRARSAAAQRASVQQATRAGFTTISSTLTFGTPADLAAAWDGALIDLYRELVPQANGELASRR